MFSRKGRAVHLIRTMPYLELERHFQPTIMRTKGHAQLTMEANLPDPPTAFLGEPPTCIVCANGSDMAAVYTTKALATHLMDHRCQLAGSSNRSSCI